MKKKFLIILSLPLAGFLIFYLFFNNFFSKPFLKIKDKVIFLEIAETEEKRIKGLSGRDFLEENKGMLFVFPRADFYGFWMINMLFPIDIIWIANGKIVGIEENVSNEFNPQNPRLYFSSEPVQYVLEVNASFTKKNNFKIGDIVIFSKNVQNIKGE